MTSTSLMTSASQGKRCWRIHEAEWIVYDALYAYAQEMVKRGKPSGRFAN
jgi:hypothetical protein